MEENRPSFQSKESQKSVVQTEYKYSALTGKIIGCAMEVHKILGNGFQEVIYSKGFLI